MTSMESVGTKLINNTFWIPEVLLSSRAMHAGLHVLRPCFKAEKAKKLRVVIGTVAGDLHDIGKKLVSIMLEAKGFEVIDIGIDVTHEYFARAVRHYQPQVLAMSSLLTTTMLEMERVIKYLEQVGLRKDSEDLVVMVGGRPVTEEYAEEIGADLYAKDASEAAHVAADYFREQCLVS